MIWKIYLNYFFSLFIMNKWKALSSKTFSVFQNVVYRVAQKECNDFDR